MQTHTHTKKQRHIQPHYLQSLEYQNCLNFRTYTKNMYKFLRPIEKKMRKSENCFNYYMKTFYLKKIIVFHDCIGILFLLFLGSLI